MEDISLTVAEVLQESSISTLQDAVLQKESAEGEDEEGEEGEDEC